LGLDEAQRVQLQSYVDALWQQFGETKEDNRAK
jgi:hypothetical protein